MLKYIELEHVGPAPAMRLDFAPRLNLLTGDNGLGKTFALDIAWWSLTLDWAGNQALPTEPRAGAPKIGFGAPEWPPHVYIPVSSTYDPSSQSWPVPSKADGQFEWVPAHVLVIYARVDGGFSVWDPIRCFRRWQGPGAPDGTPLPTADHFGTEDIWNGLNTSGKVTCNGLIRDWCTWQDRQNEAFRTLAEVVAGLSPDPQHPIRPGRPRRLSIDDAREIPTVELPYGSVPITVASAGMRRVLSLAYLMVWAYSEHRAAAALSNQPLAAHLVLLFDEVEAHLHPQWQRTFLPALLTVARRLAGSPSAEEAVQIIASTHAPLVLASMETEFDEGRDRVLTFETNNGAVSVRELPWAKQGDAVGWLVSEAFGLQQARSKEAEEAIEAAEAYMREDADALPPDLRTREAIHQRLVDVLADHDPFWPRWVVHTEKDGA